MQYNFFDIPSTDAKQSKQALNRFLRGRRVVTVQRELLREGDQGLFVRSEGVGHGVSP